MCKTLKKISPEYKEIDCVLCSHSESEEAYTRKNFILSTFSHLLQFDLTYKLCKKCGLLFMSPQLLQTCWNQYIKNATFTVMDSTIDLEAYRNGLRKIVRQALDRYVPKAASIFELGCGDGHLLHYMKNYYNCSAASGIDLSETYCRYAKTKLNLDVEKISIEDFEKPPGSFDLILSQHVLEHLSDPVTVLKKVHNLLSKQGIFMLEVPSVHYPAFSIRDMFAAHNFLFSPVTIKNVLSRTGFKIIDSEEKESLYYVLKKTSQPTYSFPNDYPDVKNSLEESLQKYKSMLADVKNRMTTYINHWCKDNSNVAIWGSGEHTVALLGDFDLTNCRIQFIIDSNEIMWGKEKFGLKIVSPDTLKTQPVDEILISSYAYEEEINKQISAIDNAVIIKKLYAD